MFRRHVLALYLLLALSTLAWSQPSKPLGANTAPPAPAAAAKPNVERMEQIIQYEVSNKTFMGAVLVARGPEIILSKGYGSANLEWNIPNSPATKFRLGSVTKQFTAAAVLRLEERGKLSLADPIKKHLPEAPAAWDAITIHHLLSHTSGIPNLTSFPDYESFKILATTPEKTISRFRDKPLDFAPGERFAYSNSGYIVLGALIEKVGGMSYAQFLQENIFTPLGMSATGYDVAATVLPQRAAGYVRGPRGPVNAPFIDMSLPFSAGGLYSTTEDLWKWQQGLAAGEVVTPADFTRMTTANKGNYGYGLTIATGKDGRQTISHGGGIEGFNTFLVYSPAGKARDANDRPADITVIVLGNLNGPTPQTIGMRLAAVALGETVVLPNERKAIALPAKMLAEYVGSYRAPSGFAFTITLEGDQLMTQATGQQKIPIFPESDSRFFLKVVDAQLEFFRDAAGRVTHAVLSQGGREMKALRE